MASLSKLILVGLVCGALTACGGGTNADNTAMADNMVMADNGAMASTDMSNNDMMANDMAGATTMTAQQFAAAAASSDAYEIAAAKVALDQSKTQSVKDFAQRMIKDHSDSTAKLKVAAGSTTPDATLTSEQQSNLDALKAASADTFDQTYAGQQVAAHEKALSMLQQYGASGGDAALKAFANKVAPTVSEHLALARKLPN